MSRVKIIGPHHLRLIDIQANHRAPTTRRCQRVVVNNPQVALEPDDLNGHEITRPNHHGTTSNFDSSGQVYNMDGCFSTASLVFQTLRSQSMLQKRKTALRGPERIAKGGMRERINDSLGDWALLKTLRGRHHRHHRGRHRLRRVHRLHHRGHLRLRRSRHRLRRRLRGGKAG